MNLGLFTSNILVAFAYFVGGYASLSLTNLPGNAAAIWPAAGVALAAILVCGTRILPGILLGSIFVQTTAFLDTSSTESIISSLSIGTIISVAAMCQAWIGAKLVRRIFDHDEALLKERSIILFCLLAGPVSCLLSATVSICTLWFKEIITATDMPLAWSTWWIGDSIGVLVFTPILLCFFARPRHIWRQRINNVALPLCVLSMTAFIVYKFSYNQELQYIEDAFEKNTINFKYELESSINLHLNTAKNLKEFFDSSNKVSPEEFPLFVQPKLSRHPEIQALEWIPKVLHKDRESFEDRLGTQIKIPNHIGKMEVSSEKEFYFPIQYLEPIAGNENALGFDISNNPEALKAAEAACVSGKVAVTDAIKLVQESSEQIGVVFYAPVYKKNDPDKKCESLSGFTASVFRLEKEIINIHKKHPDIKLSVLLKNNSLLLFSDAPVKEKTHTIPNEFQLERSYQLPVANQQWDLVFFPATEFISFYSSWTVWLIIVGGFLIAGLSGMGLLMLTGRTLQTEQKIKLRTAELQIEVIEHRLSKKAIADSEVKFRNLVEGSLQGIFVHNNFKPLFANQKCADIFGYSNPEEILELDSILEAFWVPEEQEQMERYMISQMNGDEVFDFFECRGKRKDGGLFWFQNHMTLVDWSGEEAIMGTVIDITQRKQADEQLNYQASHDALTGLINRHEFERRAERLLATARADKSEHAFCFMDLNQFKIVNDTSGHTAGDEMLRQLSALLKGVVRHRDTVARLGGDEFGALMEHCSLDDAHRVATSIQKAIQEFQFSWEGHSFKVGVSMGLVAITETDLSLSRILSDADIACYMAKDKGRNRIQVYYQEDAETAQRHGEMQWVTRINKAIEEEHFCLYAQVIEPLDKSNDSHYEILIRMLGENDDVIPPGAFLPAAERYNLISKIDRWVINATFDLLESHTDFLMKNGFCSINLSGQSLADQDFQEYVINQFIHRNIPPGKICFEITETAAITNLSVATLFLSKMRVLGCRFALDDFGSGLSSFGYLKNMEVDYLKIDGMFVKDIVDDPIDHAMVKSINEIGHVMGMQTIAEFVENDEIKGMLREIGVNYVQGYGIGKPIPFNDLLINFKNN